MNQRARITNAILWASAILAAAIVHAPQILSLYLLPILAACSLSTIGSGCCRSARKSEA